MIEATQRTNSSEEKQIDKEMRDLKKKLRKLKKAKLEKNNNVFE